LVVVGVLEGVVGRIRGAGLQAVVVRARVAVDRDLEQFVDVHRAPQVLREDPVRTVSRLDHVVPRLARRGPAAVVVVVFVVPVAGVVDGLADPPPEAVICYCSNLRADFRVCIAGIAVPVGAGAVGIGPLDLDQAVPGIVAKPLSTLISAPSPFFPFFPFFFFRAPKDDAE